MEPLNFDIQSILDAIFSFRPSAESFFSDYLAWLQLASVIISALFFGGIIYAVVKMHLVETRVERFIDVLGVSDVAKRRSVKAWQQIQKRLRAGDEANLKLAIIEADKILDEIIKLSGYRGETMSDRLKQLTPAQLSNLDGIWHVHKIRNRIVHEPEYYIAAAEAEKTISVYARAFREFGLIETTEEA
ncbi:MAG: hypothetical protein HZA37_02730 [Parcubacteria group bacterium]|nr:hypothetical protein [Parcubacteria group bacterium]